jgi:hypothetical protein
MTVFSIDQSGTSPTVTISSNMTWDAHINNVASKAQKLLGFLMRNLQIKKYKPRA